MMPSKRVSSSPISLQLLLTRRCNLDCYYCSADEFNKKEKEPELSTEEWVSLLERLKEIQVFNLTLSGGEMFLRDDIFEILETVAKCKFPKVSITTNGTLISNGTAKELKKLGFYNISVSLDGKKGTHDRIRGRESFSRTIEGIDNLIKHGIFPEILLTPLKGNYKELNDMVDMLYNMGIRELSFNPLHATGRCREKYKDIMLDFFVEIVELLEIIANIRKKYSDFKIGYHVISYQNFAKIYYNRLSSNRKKEKVKLKPCSAAHSSCNITASGWLIPCSEFFDFKGGNIRNQDILDIWRNSENFEKIRNLSNIFTDQIPYCRNCDYNVFCNAGCRADAYAVYGDLLAPDPFCPYWKEK